ncbi:hypothetical protein AHAS_Ahas14G0164800 [Arachis hypogaea]
MPEPIPVINDYIPESLPVDLDMLIESLSTRSFEPFTKEPIGTSTIASGQPLEVEHVSPSSTVFASDNSDGSPIVHQRSSLFLTTRTSRR